ncbi:MAG: SusC/RagA family TonB-linked outer membrane protein [Bacteroidetes bacterium]|uniref:SusC/RagA family TonB-linked outer membrane protein n=1 Tax=Candidatus Cryptobacteroides gallistercoris TaxID=2840765 RepID=A0A940IGG5_9BACT|nr:SusC/RagA family TonB-linked outer membrane protein [Candidatus Cryptobacteroides gallistercoris]
MNKTAFCKTVCRCLCFMSLLLCGTLLMSARPQDEGFISITMRDLPLNEVMDEITGQSGYLFINRGVDTGRTVSINVSDATIKEVCEALFTPVGISYDIQMSNIIITNAREPEPVNISGTVLGEDGFPVPGAAVIESGTSNGTTADLDGKFSLTVSDASASVTFSSLGYDSVTLPVGTRTIFNVTLREEAVALEGTVVTALGIRRDEKALSYNVQEVSSDMLTEVKNANFINALAGKVAGVTVNTSSSGVGGASKVVLRGNKSISQSSNALYVIDGIPMYNFGGRGGTEFDSKGATESIADLNPEDISSISVLTGAAAAALYGSEAANGAIMITTKAGEAGKLKVSFSSNTEFLSPFVLPEFQSVYGTGLNGSSSSGGIFSWGAYIPESARYNYTPNDYFETGHTYTNSFSVSGGTDKNQTYFSAAAVNSDGIIPNNRYDRYNFTFRNTTYFLKDRLKLDASASYIIQKDQNMTNQGVYSNPLVPAYLFPRGNNFDIYRNFERYNEATKLMEQFWGDDLVGDLRMQNPYWINYRNLRNNDKKRYMLTLSAQYDILDWLNVSGRVRIDNSSNLYTQKLYASSESTITEGGKNGHYTEARGFDSQTYADIMLNINKEFGRDWSLVANVGASINNIKTDTFTYGGPIQDNGLANVFNVMDLDDVAKRATKDGWNDETQSVFGSVEVGWKKMLYITVTGRNDWASQLAGSSQPSFFYPSAGLSWVPTALWDMGILDYMKIRGSVASVGMPFPRFLTIPTYEYDATNKIWKDKTHYPIGDLKPERTLTYEVGVEASLWQDLNINLSWYLADTYNQTFDPSLPPSSTYTTIYLQTGNVRNTGVEASVGYGHTWNGFTWDSNFTFTWNRNEIRELAADAVNPLTGEPLNLDKLDIKGLGRAKYVLKKGGTLGDLYTTSAIKRNDKGYIELDDSGQISIVDDGVDRYLGSVFPDYNLAWRNDFSWKGIRLGILFSGRIGGICYSATQANLDLYGASKATADARLAGGVLVNGREMVDAQKWYQAIGAQSGLPQYYIYDATNFRLQELSVGYTLPARWFRNVCRLTISAVGHNLWMIWCKAPFDPEAVASTGNNYQGIDYFMMPSLRSMGFNIKLDF